MLFFIFLQNRGYINRNHLSKCTKSISINSKYKQCNFPWIFFFFFFKLRILIFFQACMKETAGETKVPEQLCTCCSSPSGKLSWRCQKLPAGPGGTCWTRTHCLHFGQITFQNTFFFFFSSVLPASFLLTDSQFCSRNAAAAAGIYAAAGLRHLA